MNKERVSTGYFEDLRNLWKGYEVFFHKSGGMVTNDKGEVVVGFNRFVVIEEHPLSSDEVIKIQITKNILESEKKHFERLESKEREIVCGTVIHKTENDNLISFVKTLCSLSVNYSETDSDLVAWGYSPNTKEVFVIEGPFELNGFIDPNDFLEKILEGHPNSKGVDELIQIEESKILMRAEDYKHDLNQDVGVDYILDSTDRFFEHVSKSKEKIKALQERKKEIEALEEEEIEIIESETDN